MKGFAGYAHTMTAVEQRLGHKVKSLEQELSGAKDAVLSHAFGDHDSTRLGMSVLGACMAGQTQDRGVASRNWRDVPFLVNRIQTIREG